MWRGCRCRGEREVEVMDVGEGVFLMGFVVLEFGEGVFVVEDDVVVE